MKSTIFFLFAYLIMSCNSGGSNAPTSGTENKEVTATTETADLESPDIKVKVIGYTGGKAQLIGVFTEQQYLLDTAIIDESGQMRFKRDEPYQQGLTFILLPDQKFFQVLISEDQTFELTTNKNNLVKGMNVKGNIDNELLYKNLVFEADYQPKVNALNAQLKEMLPVSPEYAETEASRDALIKQRKDHLKEIFDNYPNALFTKYKSAGQNPELRDVRKKDGNIDSTKQLYIYRAQFWDNVDFSDERLLYTPVISNKLKRYITELTPQIADSINSAATLLSDKSLDYPEFYKYFVNWITLHYEPGKTTLMDGEAVYCHMVKNYFTNQRAFWSDSFEVYSLNRRAQEMEQSLVGKPAPDVTAKDINGELKTLSDLESPYVIVFMYSPSCDHCIEESPKMVQFYEEWKNKGVDIFGIGVDTNEEEWRAFVKEHGMDRWANVFDPTSVAIYKTYYVDTTPELYLINPDRNIIGKNLKVHQVAEMIERDQKK